MMEPTENAVAAQLAAGKCPYLAGRPPHGTYKLWPSRINVCYAGSDEGKTYKILGDEIQGRSCFAGTSAYCKCPDYEQAVAASVAPPQFGRALKPGEEAESPVRRVRKRRRKKGRQRLALAPVLYSLAFVGLLIATGTIVALVMAR